MYPLSALALTALLASPAFAAEDQPIDRPVVLVADPAVRDAAFRETVLLVTPLPDGGHLGVIANRPTDVRLASLFPDHAPSKNVRDPVYFGGPMGGVLVALLNGEASPGGKSLRMGDHVYLAVEEKVIDRIIEQTPNQARYLVGVVEWEPGELNEQLRDGVWQVADAKADSVMNGDAKHLWRDLSKAAPHSPDPAAPAVPHSPDPSAPAAPHPKEPSGTINHPQQSPGGAEFHTISY